MSTPVTIDYVYGAEISKNVLTGLDNTTFSYQRTYFDVNRHTDVIKIVKKFLSVSGKIFLSAIDGDDDWEKTTAFVSTSAHHSVVPRNMSANSLDNIWASNTVHIALGSSASGEFIKVSIGGTKWTGYDQINEAIQSGKMLKTIKNMDFKDRY